jgi:Cu+-exporting ATPase
MSAVTHEHATHETSEATLDVSGMNCASCVAHVEKAAQRVGGVQSCDVNLALGRARVRFDAAQTTPDAIAQAVTEAGYPSHAHDAAQAHAGHDQDHGHAHDAPGKWFRRAVVALALWFPVEATHWILQFAAPAHAHHAGRVDWLTWLSLITSTIAIAYVGAGFYKSAWAALRRRTTNMDVLIAMGASVAYGYSLIALLGYLIGWWRTLPDLYFMESTGLLALISLGHWLEDRARTAAGSAIRELMNLAPATALRLSPSPVVATPASPFSR